MLHSDMKANNAGFTLLELMVAITVLALLLGIGVPGFRDFVRNSRMTAATNDIVTDFSIARSEAVKRRVPVTLCKSQNLTACDTTAAAAFRTWIMFVDDADPAVAAGTDGDGVVDAGEVILRQRTIADTITVTTNANARRVTFLPSGYPNGNAAGNVTDFRLCDDRGNETSVGGNSAARAVQILPTGRPVATRDKATITTLGGCP
jgi:type IV fimbrial biogenesis protein FimT